ncbi:MAG: class I SAM-dependent methyltransferase [Chloroflexota bacterium]
MIDEQLRSFLLEGRIQPEDFEKIRDAATSHWDRAFALAPRNRKSVENVVFRRHDRTLQFVIPWVNAVAPLRGRRVVELGGGSGSSAHAFAHIAESVTSLDIDARALKAYDVRREVFGMTNMNAVLCSPNNILDNLREIWQPGDIIVMVAVLEHLTVPERIRYLSEMWSMMTPGDTLVIAETPNRLAYTESHTTGEPFLHLLPDELFFPYLETNTDEDLHQKTAYMGLYRIGELGNAATNRYRMGMGASYHEFEVALRTDLNGLLVADGFEQPMLRWFPLLTDDRLLMSYFKAKLIYAPVGFTRTVLNLILRKPADEAAFRARVKANLRRKREIYDLYGVQAM